MFSAGEAVQLDCWDGQIAGQASGRLQGFFIFLSHLIPKMFSKKTGQTSTGPHISNLGLSGFECTIMALIAPMYEAHARMMRPVVAAVQRQNL